MQEFEFILKNTSKKLRNDDILTNFEKIVIIKMLIDLVGENHVLR